MEERMFQGLWTDAREMARAAKLPEGTRSAVKVMLSTDSYRIVFLNRIREAARRWHVPLVNHVLRMAQTALFGIEIDRDVQLGEGVYLVHPLGVVIGGDAKIGARVRFYGNNTVGTVRDDGYPVIEEDVWVGAGARILGPIRIGARSRIGANAVVLSDVPPDHVAVGIPAKIHRRKDVDPVPAAAGLAPATEAPASLPAAEPERRASEAVPASEIVEP
jgi:serine O-acetyltransferase